MKFFLKTTIFIALISFSFQSHAELGDYSGWRTFLNLFSPQKADNPVTTADANAALYPLKPNPSNFDDGWSSRNYLAWQTVQLAPSTGAICGDGSPYKFFVNRVANTSNTIFYLEGGGACWDFESCSGAAGIRGARNPNGIPDNYMSILTPESALATPFVFRLHPYSRTKAQGWNMVYIPYCTGDVYFGDEVAVYEDPSEQNDPLVWHHNGLKNMRAVTAWVKNNLQSPAQMLMTGCSAGGAGSLTNYAMFKNDINSTKSFLLNDSGPIYDAPQGASVDDFPSIPLQEQIKNAWALDQNDGPFDYLESLVPQFDQSNPGTLAGGLALSNPADRMGHTHFLQDLNYSDYSYGQFFDSIKNETDQDAREQKLHERWYTDTENYVQNLSQYENYGYYIPYFRDVNESHCTTIIDFENGDIQEQGLEITDFINNILNGSGRVLEAQETDTEIDERKPFNLLYSIVESL